MLATLYWIRWEAKEWIQFLQLRVNVIRKLVPSTLPTSRSTPRAGDWIEETRAKNMQHNSATTLLNEGTEHNRA